MYHQGPMDVLSRLGACQLIHMQDVLQEHFVPLHVQKIQCIAMGVRTKTVVRIPRFVCQMSLALRIAQVWVVQYSAGPIK